MARALIINLTRFGDLLQTQPVILGLKAEGYDVGLLCLENFAPAAALLEGVAHVVTLPGGAFLAQMDKDWRLAVAELQRLLEDLRRDFSLGPHDVLINTTASLSARLLARQLAAPHETPILGFGLDSEGFGVSGDMWATFLQGTSAERLNCPFNLVDMFRMAAGVGHSPLLEAVHMQGGLRRPETGVRALVEARLNAQKPEGCAGFVAFQLGASEARRQWPVEHFAALGQKLWAELRLCPLLVGSPGERALAEAYAADGAGHPFVDCIGATDVPQLASVLLSTRLLVSNDTGTLHLAAGLGIPVLGIFLATAQPWDTGPYLPGCCCLEPALSCHPCGFSAGCSQCGEAGDDTAQACLTCISAGTVYALVRAFVCEGRWPELRQHEARVWLTGLDSDGFAVLTDLSGHGVEERSVWLHSQRYFYRHILDMLGKDEAEDACADSVLALSPPSAAGLSAEFLLSVDTVLRQAEDVLHLLSGQVALARRMPGSPAAQRLPGTCGRLTNLLSQFPPLRALGHLWQTLAQERGGDLSQFLHMAESMRCGLRHWREALQRASA